MCVMRNGRYASALRETMANVYDPTTRTPVPWLLCGETALSLQGVNIDPGLVEFRAMSQYATIYFAQLMQPFEAGLNTATMVYRRGGNCAPSDSWRSNVHQRIVAWSANGKATWLGRWFIDGVTVQVSYVRSVRPDPTARAVRTTPMRVPFENLNIATVPLEFLLAESGLKNDTQQTHRILHAMRSRGYSASALESALQDIPQDNAARLSRLLEINLVAG